MKNLYLVYTQDTQNAIINNTIKILKANGFEPALYQRRYTNSK